MHQAVRAVPTSGGMISDYGDGEEFKPEQLRSLVNSFACQSDNSPAIRLVKAIRSGSIESARSTFLELRDSVRFTFFYLEYLKWKLVFQISFQFICTHTLTHARMQVRVQARTHMDASRWSLVIRFLRNPARNHWESNSIVQCMCSIYHFL